LFRSGIGKTHLVEELLDWATQQGVTTAHARTYAAAGSLAYTPVIDWLGGEPFQMALAQLDPVWRSEVARELPDLLVQDPSLPRPEPLTERWQRQRLFEALTRLIRLIKSPLLLALDDLQWCDVETLEWLHYLFSTLGEEQDRGPTQTRLLVAGTVRTEELDADHPLRPLLLELRRAGQVTEIELEPLDAANSATLAIQAADRTLAQATVNHIVQVSEGNPLFVVEMVRNTTWGVIIGDLEASEKLETQTLDALPPKVQAVIQSRLEQLTAPARELAALAAVIGRSFTFDLLAQASDADENALVQSLDELWQRRIVREQGDNAYDFSHDRIREAAYATVSPPRERHLHRCVAQAIEQMYAGDLDSTSGQLGFHYERARCWEDGMTYYRRAADVSARLYAFEDTLFYLDKMLILLKKLPPSTGHTYQQIEILLEIANILIITKGWTAEERRLALEQAAKMARAVGDEKLLLNSLLSLYSYYGNVGDWYTCRNICDESLPLAEKFKDPISLLRANMQKADLSLHLGEFQSAFLYHQRTLLIEETSRPLHQFGSSWQTRMAEVLWFSGYPEQALKVAREAIRLIDEQGHPHARVHGIGFAIFVYHRIGDT
ncbi:MAG: AAA family ATPase, partial [Caldilineaceae bacterium]|nr:AAA family ATPase [Caldilineaceae bacterium]